MVAHQSSAKNEQADRFIETARQIGANEDEATFKEKLRVIARQKVKVEPTSERSGEDVGE